MKKLFKFVSGYNTLQARALVDFIRVQGPCEVEVREPKRSDAQNRAFHAAVRDLSKQVRWCGRKMPAGVWKRMVTFAWLRTEGEQCFAAPALDGMGIDTVWEKTSKLSVAQMSRLLDWTYAFGVENGCRFTTKDEP